MRKKSIMLNEAVGVVVILVLVALLVIIAIVLLSDLNTAMLTPDTAVNAVNETVTPTNAGVTLFGGTLTDGDCGTITKVYNASGFTLTAGNYTQTGCRLSNSTLSVNMNVTTTGTVWKVTYPYTYSASTAASNASSDLVTEFATYPTLIGLVGTIIFLGLVIGVLVASFAFGGKKGA